MAKLNSSFGSVLRASRGKFGKAGMIVAAAAACMAAGVPPVYRTVRQTEYDNCGRRVVVERQVVVRDGFWKDEHRQVVVRPGGWDNVERQELVHDGYWKDVQRQELVGAGHWEEKTVRVP